MPNHTPTFSRLFSQGRSFAWVFPRRTTNRQRQSLLRLIATASEERLPLVPLLEAWAADERGVQKGRLRRVVDLLRNGAALADAVEQVPGVLNDEDVLTIRFGSQSGILAPALRESLAQPTLLTARAAEEFRKSLVYLVVVFGMGALMSTFLYTRIVPKLYQINEDYGVEPSQVLRIATDVAEWIIQYWWLIGLVALALLLSTFSTRTGRFLRHAVAGRLSGGLRTWRAAEVLRRLALAVRTGRPLPGAVSTLARYHFDQNLRHKLLDVRNEVELGADLWQSMASVHLLTEPEVTVMKTMDPTGQRAWALQQLAESRKVRVMRRFEKLSVLLTPLAVLLLACMVLFQSLLMFLTLTTFIDNLL